jgi:cytochrome c-type protein NapC
MPEENKQASCSTAPASDKKGLMGFLSRPPRCSMLRMIVIGIVGGIAIWGSLNTGMEWTNRTEFCLSCHSMHQNYEELKKTVHYSNRTGTSVGCADCHVASSKDPLDYARKLTQKVFASKDVIGEILGTIDTPEKFETHRLAMAERVWAHMKASDSKECRNCHKFERMDTTKQKDRSAVKHEGAREDGKTCIDCHKGVAHLLPREMRKAEAATVAAAAPAAPAPATAEAPKAEAAAPAAEAPAAAPAAPAAPTAEGGIDWSKVASRKMTLFYPGQAAFEWVMDIQHHSSAQDIKDKGRFCAKCHEGDASEIGSAIVAGKGVGVSKTVQEPNPPAGKVGSIPVTMQTAHDGNKIYFRFEWVPPKLSGKKMDGKNEVKLTMMFDGGGTVEMANINGCWSTCHEDLRSMAKAADDKKTKYVKDGSLSGGKFMDLMQFRSGDKKVVDGYVTDQRVMDGGKSLLKAEGKKEGNKWVVVFERELGGKGKGDHNIVPGKVYNFGFAIHEDFTEARYHYVSLGYQFGLDKAQPDVKNYINVVKK